MKARHAVALAGVLAACLALLWSVGTAEPPPRRPHVVLVIGCTVRADQVTPYGGHPDATPFLAELAATGRRYDRVIAGGPWTRPGVTAITTGRLAGEIGLVEPGPGRNQRRLPDGVPTLASTLLDAGWVTVGHTTNPNVGSTFGFDRGFHRFGETAGRMVTGAVKVRGTEAVRSVLAEVDALGRLDRPLYLQVLLADAHLPPDVGPEEVAVFDERGASKRNRTYRAMLRRFDDAVRALAQGLEDRGIRREDTVFVVVADHGEGLELPEHHGDAHGAFLYPSTVRVPWIVAGPGVAPGVESGLASHLDVMPTVLSLVGLGEAPALPRDAVYVDTWFRAVERAAIYGPERMCERDYAGGTEACFAWTEDPGCTVPIDDPALLAELDRRRAAIYEGAAAAPEVDVDPEVQRQLEALGYGEPE